MRALPNTSQTGLMILSATLMVAPGMDVLAKLLTEKLSPGMVTFSRFAAQTILLLPLVLMVRQWSGPRLAHWLGGLFLAIAIVTINAAFAVMPIVNVIAIFFVEPLILTILSALILGERFGWRRLAAVLTGLAGALIVIRPNWELYGATTILPLITALSFACYMLVVKVLSSGADKLAQQFWTGVSVLKDRVLSS